MAEIGINKNTNHHGGSCSPQIKVLLFSTGGMRWGIDLDLIRVISTNKSTQGIKNRTRKFLYAGNDIPLVSLKKTLRIATNEDAEEEIIILEVDGKLLGLTVEVIEDVVDLSLGDDIFPLPPLIQKKKANDWIWGIAKVDNQLIFLLEPEYDFRESKSPITKQRSHSRMKHAAPKS